METKYNILTRVLKNIRNSVLPAGTPEDKGKAAVIDENGIWDKQNAGGNLPTPTADDVGKVLMVVPQYTKGASVAEQETYEFYIDHNILEFANSDFESLANAENVVVTIDGTDYFASVDHGVATVSVGIYSYTITADTKAGTVTCTLKGFDITERKTSTVAVYLATITGYVWAVESLD